METVLQHLLALVLLGSFFFVIWYAKHKNKIPEKKEGVISDEGHSQNVADSVVGEAADEKTESNERISTDSKLEQLEQVRQLYFASHNMERMDSCILQILMAISFTTSLKRIYLFLWKAI